REAVLLGGLGLRLHLRIRFVRIRALVELHHVLVGAHEALNMLLGELDLLALLPRGRAGVKQGESQKRGEQRPGDPPRVSTAYPFRMRDVAWSSISIPCCALATTTSEVFIARGRALPPRL